MHRACQWFHDEHGVTVRRVLTDNAKCYRVGTVWAAVCAALQIKRRSTKPGCPWTNGKAERFNRTLQNRLAYRTAWLGNDDRTDALADFLTFYNTAEATTRSAGTPRSADSQREQPVRSLHLAPGLGSNDSETSARSAIIPIVT